MKILLLFYSCIDLIASLMSIAIQTVIIINYDDCAYSKMAVGIWNGILLLVTSITLLLTSFDKIKKGDMLTILCAIVLMASLVQVGIASGVIYQLSSLQYIEHDSLFDGTLTDILNSFNSGFNKIGRTLAFNAKKQVQVRTCYNLIPPATYSNGSQRKNLELVLLGCGLAAICVQIASLIGLRMKRLIVSPIIQYTQTVSTSKDDILVV